MYGSIHYPYFIQERLLALDPQEARGMSSSTLIQSLDSSFSYFIGSFDPFSFMWAKADSRLAPISVGVKPDLKAKELIDNPFSSYRSYL